MVSIADIYIDEIRKQNKNFFATWTPGKPMNLGDIGVIKKNQFSLIGNLKDQGVKFKIRRDVSPMPYQFNSLDGINIFTKNSGEVNPKFSDLLELEVGFGIEFIKKGKFFFKADELYEDCIDDLITLGKQLSFIFKGKLEDKNYVIINRLIKSPLATILISNNAKSKVSLLAKADASLKKIEIGDVNVDVQVKSSSGLAFDSPRIVNATPFFGVVSVQELAKVAADFKFNRNLVHVSIKGYKGKGKSIDMNLPPAMEITSLAMKDPNKVLGKEILEKVTVRPESLQEIKHIGSGTPI